MPAKKTSSKRYVVLKCSRVNTKKAITKQGKVINMCCGATQAAKKYATAYYAQKKRSLKTVYLYRNGKVMKFTISSRTSKKTGKKVFKAKKSKTMSLSKVKSSAPCRRRKSKKSKSKSSKSKTAAKKRASLKRKRAAKKASKVRSAKKRVTKAKRSLKKTKTGTKSRTNAKRSLKKARTSLRRARSLKV